MSAILGSRFTTNALLIVLVYFEIVDRAYWAKGGWSIVVVLASLFLIYSIVKYLQKTWYVGAPELFKVYTLVFGTALGALVLFIGVSGFYLIFGSNEQYLKFLYYILLLFALPIFADTALMIVFSIITLVFVVLFRNSTLVRYRIGIIYRFFAIFYVLPWYLVHWYYRRYKETTTIGLYSGIIWAFLLGFCIWSVSTAILTFSVVHWYDFYVHLRDPRWNVE